MRAGWGRDGGDQGLLGDDPTPQREAEATAHLSFEGTRDQYVGGVPGDVAARIDPRMWQEDWRIMSLPGRLETHPAECAESMSAFVNRTEMPH